MIELVIEQRRRDLGGFEVGRVLPFAKRRMVGPFIFFDRMGPVDFPPGIPRSVDVRPHPHIGLATLTYRRRKLWRTRLVVLADVSGSMDLYARLLLQFLYALQNAFSRVETFVFATRLSSVTDELRAPGYRDALGNLSARVQDWSGGTRIGESLSAFLSGWPRLVDRRTVVVVT